MLFHKVMPDMRRIIGALSPLIITQIIEAKRALAPVSIILGLKHVLPANFSPLIGRGFRFCQ